MFFEQLNAAGGINGKQIKLLEYDDKADGTESINAYNLAKANGATAIIGSVLSGASGYAGFQADARQIRYPERPQKGIVFVFLHPNCFPRFSLWLYFCINMPARVIDRACRRRGP